MEIKPQNFFSLKKAIPIILLPLLLFLYLFYLPSPSSSVQSIYDLNIKEYDFYLSQYSKSYSSQLEYQTHFKEFIDKTSYIRVFNQANQDWYMGINQFTDLPIEEYKSKYLNLKVPNQKTHNFLSETKININTLPTSVDWRTQGAVTPVSNEGGSCGACWAFTTVEAVESAWFIAGHTLIPLSVQQLIDCSTDNGGCNGGFMDTAFEYIIKNGLTSAANYPYVGHDQKCNTTAAKKIVAKIISYQDVTSNSLNALMAAVAQQPVAVTVDALTWTTYSGGVLSSNCDSSSLNFAAVIVGYNTNINPNYWIVKNIWGTSWGVNGYIYIAMTDGQGACCINEMPSYPVV